MNNSFHWINDTAQKCMVMLLSSSCYGKNDGANHQRTQAQIDEKCLVHWKSSLKLNIHVVEKVLKVIGDPLCTKLGAYKFCRL